jgi:enamine deaminase RidA (YjgF/YER057c/UK114 family)
VILASSIETAEGPVSSGPYSQAVRTGPFVNPARATVQSNLLGFRVEVDAMLYCAEISA